MLIVWWMRVAGDVRWGRGPVEGSMSYRIRRLPVQAQEVAAPALEVMERMTQTVNTTSSSFSSFYTAIPTAYSNSR